MTGSGRLYLTILAFETENNGSTVQILYYRNIHRLEVQGLLGPNLGKPGKIPTADFVR